MQDYYLCNVFLYSPIIFFRFSSTIATEFNGHTHSDEFKIFYSPENTPINVAWGGGSLTTYSYYNLNYKIVDINGDSMVRFHRFF
jgi:hypothetical protein